MPRLSRRFGVIVSIVAVLALTLGVATAYGPFRAPDGPTNPRGGPEADEGVDKGGEEEAAEQLEKTELRNAAFAEASRQGLTGQKRPAGAEPAPGWVGEFPLDTEWDDWEPAIAADPRAPWVYALVTRYGAPPPCPVDCPSPWIALEISDDNGETWSDPKPLCACKGSGQFDPIIEVVPSTGHVYALYMKGFHVVFTKSTNHGRTWSTPVKTYGNVAWNDKPVIAMSDDGKDVYVSWNGPTNGDPWAAHSHDFGATWSQYKLAATKRYYFAFDADVAHDGTVYFSQSALIYATGDSGAVIGTIEHHVFISRNKGTIWEDRLVATVQVGAECEADGCGPDFYVGHSALSVDRKGDVVVLYDGATTSGGPQRIYALRSTDRGVTWSSPVALSKVSQNSTAPAIESRGAGDVRAFYYETFSGNDDRWNIWYRRSKDGGATWSEPVKLSDAPSGAAYKRPAGFLEVYGDYGEIAITNTGKTIATWGEGLSYTGPGGVWINREE